MANKDVLSVLGKFQNTSELLVFSCYVSIEFLCCVLVQWYPKEIDLNFLLNLLPSDAHIVLMILQKVVGPNITFREDRTGVKSKSYRSEMNRIH